MDGIIIIIILIVIGLLLYIGFDFLGGKIDMVVDALKKLAAAVEKDANRKPEKTDS
ncbi:MAG: hypothetical protein HYT27_01315 [Parcubacteria group bacterium]|nr:hypothetical protein [Parcubacteria group bacterium]